MGRETIDIGTTPGDGTGDTPKEVGDKINNMTDELYSLEAWTAATLKNGWAVASSTGSVAPSYRLDPNGKIVYLRGHLDGDSKTATTAFTLPASLHPTYRQNFKVSSSSGLLSADNLSAKVAIQKADDGSSAGAVRVMAADDFTLISLDGLFFHLD